MMKILLATPPSGFNNKGFLPPLGLGYIAAQLRHQGHEVAIRDFTASGHSLPEAVESILAWQPDAVGFTSVSSDRFATLHTVESLKSRLPDLLLFAGGPHFSLTAESTLNHWTALDAVVHGEGDLTTAELIAAVDAGRNLTSVEGISFRKGDGVVHTKARPVVRDLDTLPFPAWDLYDHALYPAYGDFPPRMKKVGVISSRGCPYSCTFCSCPAFWGPSWRKRSAQNFVDEIELLVRDFGYRAFVFWDDTFMVKDSHVQAVCEEIVRRGLRINWTAAGRINRATPENMGWMKEAGCVAITFGVESASPRVLEAIDKHIKIEKVEEVVRQALALDLYVRTFFMFRHPSETTEDALQTAHFIGRLKRISKRISVEYGNLAVFPGTEVERIAEREQVLPDNFDWSLESHSNPDRSRTVPDIPFYPPGEGVDSARIRRELLKAHLLGKGGMKYLVDKMKSMI